MSLPDTNIDEEFSRLEYLAFRGQWSKEEQKKVWNLYDMNSTVDNKTGTSPEHDRLQSLIGIFGWIDTCEADDREEFKEHLKDCISRYIAKYPSSRSQLPEVLPTGVKLEEK